MRVPYVETLLESVLGCPERPGLRTPGAADEVAELQRFVAESESKWGQPVMDPDIRSRLNGGELGIPSSYRRRKY